MVVKHTMENILEDGIAKLVEWDFATANKSHEDRVKAVTTVASICYQNDKAIGKESLYNRLEAEAHGLPSSSFEFVPVLLPEPTVVAVRKAVAESYKTPKVEKYGEWVEDGEFLLTNLRALLADNTEYKKVYGTEIVNTFNTSDRELNIIRENFRVYHFTAPLFVMRQVMRHRVNWQELSRRYVSRTRKDFKFYIKELPDKDKELDTYVKAHYNNSVILYDNLISIGWKPQDARSVLPVALYTEVWGAFQPSQLKNLIELRADKATQNETRQFATTIKEWRYEPTT